MPEFYSRGKLLLTGEYVVLQGAKALAFPLKLGQKLQITPNNSGIILWRTFEKQNEIFIAEFDFLTIDIIKSNDSQKALFIQKILLAAVQLNSKCFSDLNGFNATSTIEFDINWGLGTSSTLINNIAQFTNTNAIILNQKISKGSGYDIACASENTPITYQLKQGNPEIEKKNISYPFIENVNLVHLNKKMPTENNIRKFLSQSSINNNTLEKISEITEQIIHCKSLDYFMELLHTHEQIISSTIQKPTVKEVLFSDFNGEIKSLGAWGGDFVIAASNWSQKKQIDYFNNKGYKTVIPFKDLIV